MKKAEAFRQLLNKSYKFGKMDCFALILKYAEIVGHELPDEHMDYGIHDYVEFYPDDLEFSEEWLTTFMQEYFGEIQIGKALTGDIVLLRLNDSFPFLGIKCGNGKVIGATKEYGTRVMPLRPYKTERAFRCRF